MYKVLFIGITFSLLTISCRMDSFLYNPAGLDEYLLDDYEGDLRFSLDSSYAVADSMIDLFTLSSSGQCEEETIYCVYIGDQRRISQDTVILYCHGNAAHMDAYWQRAKLLANVGHKHRYGVLMLDYRGYGKSTGKPKEAGLYCDVNTCMEWLKGQGLSDDRLVIYGFSLGSAPATELTANARSMQPSKLILEAPFASGEYISQDASKLSLAGSFSHSLEVDNAVEIKKVEEPFLWMHGIDDAFIGIEHGELVINNYQGVHLVTKRVERGEHSTVPLEMGFKNYTQTIADFISN